MLKLNKCYMYMLNGKHPVGKPLSTQDGCFKGTVMMLLLKCTWALQVDKYKGDYV